MRIVDKKISLKKFRRITKNGPPHKELAQGRWFELTLFEQMGNIGSEVGRAIQWKKKGDHQRSEGALFRALDLFDLTVADPRRKHQLKEILLLIKTISDISSVQMKRCSK